MLKKPANRRLIFTSHNILLVGSVNVEARMWPVSHLSRCADTVGDLKWHGLVLVFAALLYCCDPRRPLSYWRLSSRKCWQVRLSARTPVRLLFPKKRPVLSRRGSAMLRLHRSPKAHARDETTCRVHSRSDVCLQMWSYFKRLSLKGVFTKRAASRH